MNDEVDPMLVAILMQLWRAEQETPGRDWSLAKLSKQAGVPMSTLRRHLTALADGGIATARLTDAGRSLCADLFRDPAE
jgi:DNA-binding IclR family transcriptional regulator